MEPMADARRRKHWMRACAVGMALLALAVVFSSSEVSWWRALLRVRRLLEEPAEERGSLSGRKSNMIMAAARTSTRPKSKR